VSASRLTMRMPRFTASRTKLPPMNPAPPVTSQVVMTMPRRKRLGGKRASERDVVVREIVGRRRLRRGCLASRRGRRATAAVFLALRSRCTVAATTALAAAAEHLHLVGDDVGGVVLDAVLLVGTVFEPALEV